MTLEELVSSSPIIVRAVPDGAPTLKRVFFGESPLPKSHPLRPPSEVKIPLHPFRIESVLKASGSVADRIAVMSYEAEQSLDWATRMHRDGTSKSYIVPRYASVPGLELDALGERPVLLFLRGHDAEFILAAEGALEDPRQEPVVLTLIRGAGA